MYSPVFPIPGECLQREVGAMTLILPITPFSCQTKIRKLCMKGLFHEPLSDKRVGRFFKIIEDMAEFYLILEGLGGKSDGVTWLHEEFFMDFYFRFITLLLFTYTTLLLSRKKIFKI